MSPARDAAKKDVDEAVAPPPRVTKADIENKFRELQGGVDEVADQAVSYVLVAGAAIIAGVVVIAFVFGRRRGRKKSTIVEVRRL